MKNIQLVIRNIETRETLVKNESFETVEFAIENFTKCWDKKYFELLSAEKIFTNQDLWVGDEVTIVSSDEDGKLSINVDQTKYIGEKGRIQKIENSWEWPYLIRFDNKDLNNPMLLWKRYNLRAV